MEEQPRWQLERGYFDVVGDKSVPWPYPMAMDYYWMEFYHNKYQKFLDERDETWWKRQFGLGPKPTSDKYLDADTVKDKVDMMELLQEYGLSPPSTSARRSMKCPFHNDKRPSFSVDYDKKLWYCHTGCGGWDSIKFVQKMESCDFMTALRKLNEIFI